MAEILHYICPTCGKDAEVGKPCPGCPQPTAKGRPKKKRPAKPWSQDAAYDGADLPDEDFDYDEFVQREFGKAPHRRTGLKWHWWALALVLLTLMVLGLVAVLPFWFSH